MSETIWSDLHANYRGRDWAAKPSLFAETAVSYFPQGAKVLDLLA
jgi:hypothetical protein